MDVLSLTVVFNGALTDPVNHSEKECKAICLRGRPKMSAYIPINVILHWLAIVPAIGA